MDKMKVEEKIMAEEMWLKYYNNVLFEINLITTEQRDRMILAIESRCDQRRKQTKRDYDFTK